MKMLINKKKAVWTAHALENALLFSIAILLYKVWFVCHHINRINDDKALEEGTVKQGQRRRWFSKEPDGSCIGSCSSAELFDRNQRGKSLVTNQLSLQSASMNTLFL